MSAVPELGSPMATEEDESERLCRQLQNEELGSMMHGMEQPSFEGEELDEETRQSLELAWRLQEEERQRHAEQTAAAERLQNEPEDAESIALAIRLQQEDDEQALRNAIGLQGDEDDEPGSPSSYSYEQLMRLSQTIGEVSRGASSEQILALRTMTVEEARADSSILLGEQVRDRRVTPLPLSRAASGATAGGRYP